MFIVPLQKIDSERFCLRHVQERGSKQLLAAKAGAADFLLRSHAILGKLGAQDGADLGS
jgi:hypothetical protein